MAPGGEGGVQLLGLGLGLEAKVCAGPGSGARWRLAPDPQAWSALHAHPSLCGPGGGTVRLPHPLWPQVPPDPALLGPGTPAGQGRFDGQWEGRPSPPASKLPHSWGLSPGGPSGVRPAGWMPLYAEAAVGRHRYRQLCCLVGHRPPARMGVCAAPPGRARADPQPSSEPPCWACAPRLSSSPVSTWLASAPLRATTCARGSQRPRAGCTVSDPDTPAWHRFQGILGGKAPGAAGKRGW